MGIYDRDYARERPRTRGPGGPGGRSVGGLGMWSVNTWLIVINIAVFILGAALSGAPRPMLVRSEIEPNIPPDRLVEQRADAQGPIRSGAIETRPVFDRQTGQRVGTTQYWYMDPIKAFGFFSTATGFMKLEVWRLVTFQFLHANLTHLLFNMFGLFIFGGVVEQYLGRKRYLAYYLVCGIFGGLTYLMLNLLGFFGIKIPFVLINDVHTPLVGASAGVFGVIIACAYIIPNSVVQLIFPPIPLKMKWLAYGYVALAAFNLFRSGQNAGGDAAHVGGALAGYFFIRNSHLLRDFFDVFKDSRKEPGGLRSKRVITETGEVDRVLDKVKEKGVGSLSEKEKRILQQETKKRRGS